MSHGILYYDMDGNPVSEAEGLKLFNNKLRRVAATDTRTGYYISTVHLVIDHGFGNGPPLIFETMVFRRKAGGGMGSSSELDCERYHTKAEALAGHAAMVRKWSRRNPVRDE